MPITDPHVDLCSERGATMLEVALSLVVLLALTFAVMEACLALYRYHYIAEAAREGTRYAMVRGSSCTGFPSACPATQNDIKSYVKGLGFPGIDPNAMTVTPGWPNGNNNPGNAVSVKVQYPFQIPILFSGSVSMSSTSQMVISQ